MTERHNMALLTINHCKTVLYRLILSIFLLKLKSQVSDVAPRPLFKKTLQNIELFQVPYEMQFFYKRHLFRLF